MKKEHGLIVVLISILLLIDFVKSYSSQVVVTERVVGGNPSEAFALTPDEIIKLKFSADAGDEKSAMRLFEYYYILKQDNANGRLWLKRWGDLGDKSAQDLYASLYELRK